MASKFCRSLGSSWYRGSPELSDGKWGAAKATAIIDVRYDRLNAWTTFKRLLDMDALPLLQSVKVYEPSRHRHQLHRSPSHPEFVWPIGAECKPHTFLFWLHIIKGSFSHVQKPLISANMGVFYFLRLIRNTVKFVLIFTNIQISRC